MLPVVNDPAAAGRNASMLWDRTALTPCHIVFISDNINTRVVSNIIEQEVSTPETVKDTFSGCAKRCKPALHITNISFGTNEV